MVKKERHWGRYIKKELGDTWYKLSDEAKLAIVSFGSLGSVLASAQAVAPEALPIIYPLLGVAGVAGGTALIARKKVREQIEASEKKSRKRKLKKVM